MANTIAYEASDRTGHAHRADTAEQAAVNAYMAKAPGIKRRPVLVCAVKLTESGNEYQVPYAYWDGSQLTR